MPCSDGCYRFRTLSYFMVWTSHGFVIDHIDFDGNKWFLLKLEYQKYYLKTIFNED